MFQILTFQILLELSFFGQIFVIRIFNYFQLRNLLSLVLNLVLKFFAINLQLFECLTLAENFLSDHFLIFESLNFIYKVFIQLFGSL